MIWKNILQNWRFIVHKWVCASLNMKKILIKMEFKYIALIDVHDLTVTC